jgi:hypothetical protein
MAGFIAIDRDHELFLKYKIETFLQSVRSLFPVERIVPETFMLEHASSVLKTSIIKELLQRAYPAHFNNSSPLSVLSNNCGTVLINSVEVKNLIRFLRDVFYEQITLNNIGFIERLVELGRV